MRRVALALLVSVLLAGCSDGAMASSARQRGCDDGGSGGVVIDGVCL